MKRIILIIVAASAMLLASVGIAMAHVEFSPSTVGTDEAVLVTLTVPHDCNGKGTTSLEMQVPKQVTIFTPVNLAGWTIATTEASGGSGDSMSHMTSMEAGSTGSHVDTVTWTHSGGPVPHGQAIALQALVAVSAKSKGTDLHLPTIQNCPDGQKISWIDVPAKGQDMEDLEHPAPMLTAESDSASSDSGTTMKVTQVTTKSNAAADKVAKDAKDTATTSRNIAILALIVSVIALIGGIVAGRRK